MNAKKKIKDTKATIKQIKEFCKRYNCKCISENYISKTKLVIKCDKGHIFETSWVNFKYGTRCPVCAGNKRKTINEINNILIKEGYKCLSTKYKNNRSKLKFRCLKNHIYESTWDYFQRGSRCPICAIVNSSGPNCHFWKGGIAYEPYCSTWMDEEFINFIKERDGKKCLNPSCNGTNPFNVVRHHIDYNKNNCDPINIITICQSCNSTANGSREWYKSWYEAIMNRRIYGNKKRSMGRKI